MTEEPPHPITRDEVRAAPVPFDRLPFDHDHCFLCGAAIQPESRTREHVFPAWLQHRYDLWDQELTLLNGTSIPYRQLTIPCCAQCNGGPLSRLEDEVRMAVESGYEGVARLPHLRIFQWAAKVMFGILFKEISLAMDRRDPGAASILPPTHLDSFSTLHDLLQSVRVEARFEGGPIYTVLVAPLHDLGGWRPFDFADSIDDQVVAFRLGTVGIIASLSDGGVAGEHWSRVLGAFGAHPLHPIQFDEMVAHVVATRQRMTRAVRIVMSANITDGSNLTFVRPPLMGFSLKPLLVPFDSEVFRPILRHFLHRWGKTTEPVWSRPGEVGTTIFEREGHVGRCDKDFNLIDVASYE
jgi:hypothetical protein